MKLPNPCIDFLPRRKSAPAPVFTLISQRARPTIKRRSGQTIVETSLVLAFILLPLTLGLLQFGIILNAANTMTQIAREGGRYAAVHGQQDTFDGPATAPAAGKQASLRYYLKTVADPTGIRWADIQNNIVVTPATPAARVSGQPVSVSVTYPMSKKVFLGSAAFIGPALNKVKQPYVAKSTFVAE